MSTGEEPVTLKGWRVFCAIDLPEQVRAAVAERAARLRAGFPAVRASWERPEKLHITLKFLGEVEPARVADLSQAAALASVNIAPFELAIRGAGAFPPRGAPRVLWLGVADSSGGLARLHSRLEDECAAGGFPRERRAFSPHLTIARLRDPRGADPLAAAHATAGFTEIAFPVTALCVVRSQLEHSG
jgi:RNA 2',3'-cyclic 3'-phosphodiesterase